MKAFKKLIAGIFALTIVFAMMTAKDSIRVSAASVSAGSAVTMTTDSFSYEWDYTVNNKAEVEIQGYKGTSEKLVIPTSINGKKVRKICKGAFSSCVIREITMPANLYTIEEDAFRGCCGLKEIRLPEGLRTIGKGAFAKSSVEKINIPDSVKIISESTFEDSSLTSIEFGNGILNIEQNAFKGCSKLMAADLPSSVVNIGKYAFKGTGIEKFVVPEKVTVIEESLFEDSQLSYLSFAENSKIRSIGTKAFSGCRSMKAVKFPESLRTIEDGAFEHSGIVNAEIPAGVTYIGSGVYYGSDLEELTLKGVPEMSQNAFIMCTELKNLNMDTDAVFDGSVFNGCRGLMLINDFTVNGIGSGDHPFFNGIVKDFVMNNFRGSTDVGFMNQYIKDEINYIISETITDDMSEVEKVKALQEWVCNNAAYNKENYSLSSNFVDSSIFLNDFTVCDGYARGMALLLQGAGFEVYYVANEIHAWDIVKVGDHYFHVDATYADAFSKGISYKRFLSNDSRNYEYNNYWELESPSSLYNYSSDTVLPESTYSSGDVNMDGVVDDSDYEYLCMYLNGEIEIAKGDEILADVDFDGEITENDALTLMNNLDNYVYA